MTDRDKLERLDGLTKRQRQVYQYLLRGITMRQIAYELGIARQTLAAHNRAIYRHFGVPGRLEILADELRIAHSIIDTIRKENSDEHGAR